MRIHHELFIAGGWAKPAGIGRELGPEGIDGYLEYQSIILPAG